jgi:hypothetical protein
MNPADLLMHIQRSLKAGPMTLEQLQFEHASFWNAHNWQLEQISLYLACLPSIQHITLANHEPAYALANPASVNALSLADELVALLEKSGRPMPIAQLVGKLPAGMIVTEAMLRTTAQQDSRLASLGPLLKLA